jgi:hypothetical protein
MIINVARRISLDRETDVKERLHVVFATGICASWLCILNLVIHHDTRDEHEQKLHVVSRYSKIHIYNFSFYLDTVRSPTRIIRRRKTVSLITFA